MTDEIKDGERWRPVPAYAGYYEVSQLGRVRSLPRNDRRGRRVVGGMRKPHIAASGYPCVTLHRDGSSQTHYVHSLVLEAFVGPRPPGAEACHGEGGPSDNRVDNLRWDTHRENVLDIVRHGHHQLANQVKCKRGHDLTEPNLVPSKSARGSRACHACALAASYAYTRHEALSTAVADEFYQEIMTGVYRPSRGVQR